VRPKSPTLVEPPCSPAAAAGSFGPLHARRSTAQAAPSFRVLVFSRPRLPARLDPAGIAAIQKLGRQKQLVVDATENDTLFTDANLARYQP